MTDDAAHQVVYAAGGGIFVWFVLALSFDSTDWTQRAHLTVVGGTLELIGIALVAMDFWLPWLTRAGRRARHGLRRWLDDVWLYVHQLGGRYAFEVSDDAVTPGAMDSLERQIRIGGASPDVEEALNEYADRIGELERGVDDLGKRLRSVLSTVDQILDQDRTRFSGWRVLGLGIAFSGTVVLAAANLV